MSEPKECKACGGWGYYLAEVWTGDRDYIVEELTECEVCDGTGEEREEDGPEVH